MLDGDAVRLIGVDVWLFEHIISFSTTVLYHAEPAFNNASLLIG